MGTDKKTRNRLAVTRLNGTYPFSLIHAHPCYPWFSFFALTVPQNPGLRGNDVRERRSWAAAGPRLAVHGQPHQSTDGRRRASWKDPASAERAARPGQGQKRRRWECRPRNGGG